MTNQDEFTTLTGAFPQDQAITQIDGNDLHQMFSTGFDWLKQHSHIVNALNVFPVPDGDTGTNMVLTMQSAWGKAAEQLDDDIRVVAQAYAQGAIRGARGNSGVILSQILRGFSEQLVDAPTIDAKQFAAAMQQATQIAYKGVLKPVEGTILTVIREAAAASGHAAAISPDLRFVFDTTLLKAKQALDDTPNLLPVLKQAGVVDAGGQGLYYILEGMAKYLHGEPLPAPERLTVAAPPEAMPQPDLDVFTAEEWGYDIQYLIFGDDLDEDEIRRQLLDMGGESVVVGRAGNVVKVHVHNEDPGPFISYGAALGHLDDIVLENMTLQTLRRKGEWREDAPKAHTSPVRPETPETQRECPGVVAVASGEGLRKVFESLGVCAVVMGGQTMNPSTEDLLHAAEQLPYDDVIILPNNKNIILAARQAATISEKRIHVIETRSVPQGISAMWGYKPEASVEQNLAAMTDAYQDTISAEVTTAVRDASFDGIDVKKGDLIGLIDGKLRCRGDNLDDLVQRILERMDPDGETEVFTLYYGEDVAKNDAKALLDRLKPLFPEHEIEWLYGGQPHYHYIISAE